MKFYLLVRDDQHPIFLNHRRLYYSGLIFYVKTRKLPRTKEGLPVYQFFDD